MAAIRPDNDQGGAERLQLVESLRRSGIGAEVTGGNMPSDRGRWWQKPAIWLIFSLALLAGLWALIDGSLFRTPDNRIAVQVADITAPSGDAGTGTMEPGGIEATGYVVAERTTTVSSSVVGRVSEILVSVGDRVRSGEAVAHMDDSVQRIELERLEIDLQTAFVNMRARDAEYSLARNELERAQYLVERGAASPVLLEERQNRLDVVTAEREAVALAIESTRKRIALQQQIIRELVILAPFNGLVTHVAANPGEIVSPASSGGTFTRSGICTIIDMDSIAVSVQINERFLPRIAIGDQIEMSFPALGEKRLTGAVMRLAPFADRQTGTIDILVEPAPDARAELRPGMRALARFAVSSNASAPSEAASWILPAGAVIRDDAGDHVFAYREGRATRIAVKGRRLEDGSYRLDSPWASRLPVITWSKTPLNDGSAVEIR